MEKISHVKHGKRALPVVLHQTVLFTKFTRTYRCNKNTACIQGSLSDSPSLSLSLSLSLMLLSIPVVVFSLSLSLSLSIYIYIYIYLYMLYVFRRYYFLKGVFAHRKDCYTSGCVCSYILPSE